MNGAFSLFTYKVIIDRYVFIAIYYDRYVFKPCFPVDFCSSPFFLSSFCLSFCSLMIFFCTIFEFLSFGFCESVVGFIYGYHGGSCIMAHNYIYLL